MTLLTDRTLLEPLPDVLRSSAGVTVFDPHGERVDAVGFDDEFVRAEQAEAAAEDPAGARRVIVRPRPEGGLVAVSVPRHVSEPADGLLDAVLDALVDAGLAKQQLESEIESMSMSSLALLEEASMVTEVMTELSIGDSEREIVAQGMNKLVVGAAASRGLYYRYDVSRDVFELLAHVEFDPAARRTRRREPVVDPAVSPILVPVDGILSRAAAAPRDSAILETVTGRPDSGLGPEIAKHELLAAPVRHGQDNAARLLGVLVLADKRATSYSDVREFGSHETKLASGLASMLAAVLGARLTAEFGKELEMATSIQQQILPDRPARVGGFDLAGRCETSGAVGGDYFDYLEMADGRTMCVVADVSGHNLASGMVMVSARSALRLLAATQRDVASVFDELAATLHVDLSRTERFITAAGVAIAPNVGGVEIVNAGHNDTMVYRAATGRVERVPSEDTILGFLPGVRYGRQSLDLEPGDAILLYTDGVTEAVDVDGEMFDESRLETVLRELGSRSAQEILDGVYDAVSAFRDLEAGTDDITAMVIQRVQEGEV